MNLGSAVTFDTDLRYVSELPNPRVLAYGELNAHLGWNVTDHVQLSLSGFNLIHAHHQESPGPAAGAVPRSVAAALQWRF